jgi:two-component sensor histidine kinase
MARIDFALYLRQLIDGIGANFRKASGKISLASGDGNFSLSLEQAIPAGLSAYELITNAMRHAYPSGSPQGRIAVSLRRTGSSIELSTRDEGVGLSAGFAADKADSLGMILLYSLAAQLRGKLEFKSDMGTEAILLFPMA